MLHAVVTFTPTEEHPRDVMGFELFTDSQARDDRLQALQPRAEGQDGIRYWTMKLPLEQTFISHGYAKQPLNPESMEGQLVQSLRKLAYATKKMPLSHAYRCLATCLENLARYGGGDAIARTAALAKRLGQMHCSAPFRMAFCEAHQLLLRLIRALPEAKTDKSANGSNTTAPERVFYVSVVNTGCDALPLVRIRLFRQKHHAAACLTEWLRQYGIPYEVWRSMRSVMADDLLPYAQDSLLIDMGEKIIHG